MCPVARLATPSRKSPPGWFGGGREGGMLRREGRQSISSHPIKASPPWLAQPSMNERLLPPPTLIPSGRQPTAATSRAPIGLRRVPTAGRRKTGGISTTVSRTDGPRRFGSERALPITTIPCDRPRVVELGNGVRRTRISGFGRPATAALDRPGGNRIRPITASTVESYPKAARWNNRLRVLRASHRMGLRNVAASTCVEASPVVSKAVQAAGISTEGIGY
jgi:hypothetical protein